MIKYIRNTLAITASLVILATAAAPVASAAPATKPAATGLTCAATYEFDLKNMVDDKGVFHFVYKVRFENKGATPLAAKVPVRIYTSVRSLKGLPTTKPFWSTTQYVGKLPAGGAQNLTFSKASVGLTSAELKAYRTDPNAFMHTKRLSFTAQYTAGGTQINCSQSRVMDIARTTTTGNSPKTVYINNRNYIDL